MKMEITALLAPSDMTISATFTCRKDMDKFRLVFEKLYDLFPPPIPAPPPIDNAHVADGCEQFTGSIPDATPTDTEGVKP